MDSEYIKKLKGLVRAAEIRIITIDTSIFRRYGAALDVGLFSQLSQFKESRFQLVFSEIVMREISRHRIESIQADLDGWAKFAKKLRCLPRATRQISSLDKVLKDTSPSAVVFMEINKFLINTAANVISADHAKLEDVLNLYFEKKPPFANGGKKSEFPDAIALLGIEAWCIAARAGAIVVTDDADWKDYCAHSKAKLYVLDNLATALDVINDSEGERRERAISRQRMLVDKLNSDQFREEIKCQLKERLLEKVQVKGNSRLAFYSNIKRIDINALTFDNPARARDDDKGFSVLFDLYAACTFWVDFYFYSQEGGKNLGRKVGKLDLNVDGLLILSIEDDTNLIEVDLENDGPIIDFGDVEPASE